MNGSPTRDELAIAGRRNVTEDYHGVFAARLDETTDQQITLLWKEATAHIQEIERSVSPAHLRALRVEEVAMRIFDEE